MLRSVLCVFALLSAFSFALPPFSPPLCVCVPLLFFFPALLSHGACVVLLHVCVSPPLASFAHRDDASHLPGVVCLPPLDDLQLIPWRNVMSSVERMEHRESLRNQNLLQMK